MPALKMPSGQLLTFGEACLHHLPLDDGKILWFLVRLLDPQLLKDVYF